MHDDAAGARGGGAIAHMISSALTISICGHARHGKSTIAGRLMYALGAVSEKELNKFQQEASVLGKDVNAFSLIFLKHQPDSFAEGSIERARSFLCGQCACRTTACSPSSTLQARAI